jgi:hypothetical protein
VGPLIGESGESGEKKSGVTRKKVQKMKVRIKIKKGVGEGLSIGKQNKK